MVTIGTGDTIAKAIQKLAAVGVHRLYINSNSKAPIGVTSLIDVLRFINAGGVRVEMK